MAKERRIHRTGPTFACVSLLCGVLFAIGHHLFYRSLAGTSATNGDNDYDLYFANLSSQQINIAVGTGFAFLVKACLIVPITTAYIQLFWHEIVLRGRNINLETLDSISDGITNYLTLLRGWIWCRHPFLFVVALSSCLLAKLLPLAAILTPATLSVASRPNTPPHTSVIQVPSPGFMSLSYLAPVKTYSQNAEDPSELSEYRYNGPSAAIDNIVRQVANGGKVLPFPAQGVNSSWTLRYPAPTLQCSDMEGSAREAIMNNFADQYNKTTRLYLYHAWTYQWNQYEFSSNAAKPSNLLLTFLPGGIFGFKVNPAIVNREAKKPAQIYFATIHENYTEVTPSTLIKCEMFNATFETGFSFINAEQSVSTTITDIADTVSQGVGTIIVPKFSFDTCQHTFRGPKDQPCTFDQSLPSTLSYQAIFEAFSSLLTGSISWNYYPVPEIETTIIDTALIHSPELQYAKDSVSASSLQWEFHTHNISLFRGFGRQPWTLAQDAQPLARGLENTFRDIVVSSMTDLILQADPESQFSPPPSNVTYHTYHNVYVYSAVKLWIAYGVAIFVACIVCLIGFGIMIANGACYSFNFSSICRFASGATIEPKIRDEDTSSQDPLPAYLAKANIEHNVGKGMGKGDKGSDASAASVQLLPDAAQNKQPTSSVTP